MITPILQKKKTEAQQALGFEPKQSGSEACACNHHTVLSLFMSCIYTAIYNSHSTLKNIYNTWKGEKQGPGRQVTNQKLSV